MCDPPFVQQEKGQSALQLYHDIWCCNGHLQNSELHPPLLKFILMSVSIEQIYKDCRRDVGKKDMDQRGTFWPTLGRRGATSTGDKVSRFEVECRRQHDEGTTQHWRPNRQTVSLKVFLIVD